MASTYRKSSITWTCRRYAVLGKFSLIQDDAEAKPALIYVLAYSKEDALDRANQILDQAVVLFEERLD